MLALQSDDGSRLTIELPAGSVFAMKMLQRADSHEAIVPVVCEIFGFANRRVCNARRTCAAADARGAFPARSCARFRSCA